VLGEDAERLCGSEVSDTTVRDRRDEWIRAGVFDAIATPPPARPLPMTGAARTTTVTPPTRSSPSLPAAERAGDLVAAPVPDVQQ
jgi:hypothetical protein